LFLEQAFAAKATESEEGYCNLEPMQIHLTWLSERLEKAATPTPTGMCQAARYWGYQVTYIACFCQR
jgi:hypothetical protein